MSKILGIFGGTVAAVATVIAVIVVVLIVAIGWVIGVRNTLVQMEEDVDNAWAQVEVQYQRRYDLIPNLVESVKGIMTQEQEIFEAIADARTRYAGSESGSAEQVEAANELESSLARLLVIMENYPELKSSENVQDLMTQLEGTENRISVERSRYNDSVTDFNKTIKVFPNSIVASFFGFEEKIRFEAVEGAEEAPSVDLTTDEDNSDEANE